MSYFKKLTQLTQTQDSKQDLIHNVCIKMYRIHRFFLPIIHTSASLIKRVKSTKLLQRCGVS